MIEAAGILIYRQTSNGVEVLLTHPAGPIWGHRDVWSIPKGELDPEEDHKSAAKREFLEETSIDIPEGGWLDLGSFTQDKRKTNYIWAIEGNPDLSGFECNHFEMEWPPKSGQMQSFPENDRVEWFSLEIAVQKLFKYQVVFIQRLAEELGVDIPEPPEQQSLL